MNNLFKFLIFCFFILMITSCSKDNEIKSYPIRQDSLQFIECTKVIEKEVGYEYQAITISDEEEITNLMLNLNDTVKDYRNDLDGPHPDYNFKYETDTGDKITIGISKTDQQGRVFLYIEKSTGEKFSFMTNLNEKYYEKITEVYQIIEN